jgi:putative thioredoxin
MSAGSAIRRNGAAGRPSFGGLQAAFNEVEDFGRDVLAHSRELPVLVHFWAPWNAACLQLSAVLQRVAAERTGRVRLASVNVDMHPELVSRLGIEGVPTVWLYTRAGAVGEITGAVPDRTLADWLDQVLAALPPERDIRSPETRKPA